MRTNKGKLGDTPYCAARTRSSKYFQVEAPNPVEVSIDHPGDHRGTHFLGTQNSKATDITHSYEAYSRVGQ
jgi:hypothetical protein